MPREKQQPKEFDPKHQREEKGGGRELDPREQREYESPSKRAKEEHRDDDRDG